VDEIVNRVYWVLNMPYVIYEIDYDKYWCGGSEWSSILDYAMVLYSIDEVDAAMSGLYRQYSDYNLMYRKVRVR